MESWRRNGDPERRELGRRMGMRWRCWVSPWLGRIFLGFATCSIKRPLDLYKMGPGKTSSCRWEHVFGRHWGWLLGYSGLFCPEEVTINEQVSALPSPCLASCLAMCFLSVSHDFLLWYHLLQCGIAKGGPHQSPAAVSITLFNIPVYKLNNLFFK